MDGPKSPFLYITLSILTKSVMVCLTHLVSLNVLSDTKGETWTQYFHQSQAISSYHSAKEFQFLIAYLALTINQKILLLPKESCKWLMKLPQILTSRTSKINTTFISGTLHIHGFLSVFTFPGSPFSSHA